MKLRVGLTGGIGAGKSAVAAILRDLGALVIDADELAREAVAPGSEGLARVAERWPEVVRDGALDRAALARIVFADPSAREALNAIVHPTVRRLAAERDSQAGADQIVVHEIPLLFETGYADVCDKNVVVVAPRDARIARLLARGGLTLEEIEHRMAAQIDPDRARELADLAIENDGSLEDLRTRTRSVYAQLERQSSPRKL